MGPEDDGVLEVLRIQSRELIERQVAVTLKESGSRYNRVQALLEVQEAVSKRTVKWSNTAHAALAQQAVEEVFAKMIRQASN